MAKKIQYWDKDQFVTYDELSFYQNISGAQRELNYNRSEAKGLDVITFTDVCPICCKPLTSAYRTLKYIDDCGNSCYYYNPDAPGVEQKIGNTCFKALKQAYEAKYKS